MIGGIKETLGVTNYLSSYFVKLFGLVWYRIIVLSGNCNFTLLFAPPVSLTCGRRPHKPSFSSERYGGFHQQVLV